MPTRGFWALALLALATVPGALGTFPYCRCIPSGPFDVLKYVDRLDGAFCFQITKRPCQGQCCGMDLRKIEWDVQPTCRGTIVNATINGLAPNQQPFFSAVGDTPSGKATLKLSGLRLSNAAANGTIICLTLRGRCTTLEQLCARPAGQPTGICSTAMFNTKDTCCPLSTTGWWFPSPPPPATPSSPPPPRPSPPPPTPPTPSPPPSPAPPASCPVCLSISSPNATRFALTQFVCNAFADYVNTNWAAATNGTRLLSDFACSSATAGKVTVCGTAAGPADTVNLSAFTENLFEINRLLESLQLSCLYPLIKGSLMSYVTEYGGCKAGFSFTQDCTQPGPNGFPFCECNRKPNATSFALAPSISVRPGATVRSSQYCFTAITVAPYNASSPCGMSTSIYKAELYVKPSSRGSVSGVTAAGAPVSPVWDSSGKVFRITNLGWNTTFVAANKPQICIELRNATLSNFCQDNNCAYALFDDTKGCCPMGTANLG